MTDWLAAAHELATAEPLRPRTPLYLMGDGGPSRIGSIEPTLVAAMAQAGLPVGVHHGLHVVHEPADASLAAIAAWLRAEGLSGPWRDELLAVVDDSRQPLGRIERGAVRPLGLTTFAVHLIGRDEPDTSTWIQLRAFDKVTDPGLWDTLVGGQVAAGESIAKTLERETMEEAGLDIAALLDVTRCAPLTIRRPVAEGYMVEHLEVFRARLPAGMVPVNRDGEVARFECLDDATLRQRLGEGGFTLEASLLLAAELDRKAAPGSDGGLG